VTERLRTDLAEQPAETHSPIVRPAPASRWAGRAAICRVPAAADPAVAIVLVEGRATDLAQGEGIESEAGTSRAVAAETGMLSEEVPGVRGDTTDRAHGLAAAVAPRVWDLEAEE
jgi:hypothetical protein